MEIRFYSMFYFPGVVISLLSCRTHPFFPQPFSDEPVRRSHVPQARPPKVRAVLEENDSNHLFLFLINFLIKKNYIYK
jgi:hypothetical protein